MPAYEQSRSIASGRFAAALELPVPRSATALMQLLQLLVGRERHQLWCGGAIAPSKLPAFVKKFSERYPITRSTRGRSYDRKRGRAVTHFVAFPTGDIVLWWLLSDAGRGGLGDPASPDAHVARNAMHADSHITYADYVLLYATKKETHTVPDRRTGKPKAITSDTSTWTWKLRSAVMSELRAAVDECCRQLAYGEEGSAERRAWGLRGLLAMQRQRPLFSGVRNQVIDLHRYARDAWQPQRPKWLARHGELARRYGAAAGVLRPLNDVIENRLPKMRRLPVYDNPPLTIGAVCESVQPNPSQKVTG